MIKKIFSDYIEVVLVFALLFTIVVILGIGLLFSSPTCEVLTLDGVECIVCDTGISCNWPEE